MRIQVAAIGATIVLALSGCAVTTESDDPRYTEMWKCRTWDGTVNVITTTTSYGYSYTTEHKTGLSNNVTLTLYKRNEGRNNGRVIIHGITETTANYKIDGIDHVWSWDLDDNYKYRNTITLDNDGIARYFDFDLDHDKDGVVTESRKFDCGY